jgi:hypothetical protein
MEDRHKRLSAVLANFSTLETRLLECLDFLPYTKENWRVVSPRFAPIILDACSLTDSVLRHFAGLSNERANFKRFATELDEHLDLQDAISVFLTTDLVFLNPFASWKTKVPTWWTAYNRLKHDRLNHCAEATYENAVSALCALHQVLARDRDFIPRLISAGWFNTDDPQFAELICAQHIEIGVKPIHVMPAESRLFVTPIHSNFVEYKNGRPYLKDDCQFSPRAAAMISAVECMDAGEYMEPQQ